MKYTEFQKIKNGIENLDAITLFDIGESFNYGWHDFPKDIDHAIHYYTVASEKGYIKAFVSLGDIYHFGFNGIEKNDNIASDYYKKAADQGSAEGYFSLGYVTEAPSDIEYFLKAAELGHKFAMTKVASIYHYRLENYEKAFYWNSKAIESDDDYAIDLSAYRMLGECYEYGYGCEKNITDAIRYYKLAVSKGEDPIAAFRLGEIYAYGEDSIRPDEKISEKYFTLAKSLGLNFDTEDEDNDES